MPTPSTARSLAAHAATGMVAGAGFAAALVAIESCVLGAWWAGAVVAPHGLAETGMFDFLTELAALVQARLPILPPPVGGAYGPGVAGTARLALDLAAAALPLGLVLGLVVGLARAALGRPVSARAVVGTLAAVGLAVELTGWVAGVYVPVSGSFAAIVRGAIRDFVWNGVLASLAALGLAWAASARFATWRPRPAAAPRTGRAALPLVLIALGVGLWGAAASVGPAPAARPPLGLAEPAAARPARMPNVVLVSIDTLRADHLGCYGHENPTSPRIDALAASGTRFARAWSTSSWTLPSHVSMLSGRSLLGHGVLGESTIPAGVPMLAEVLRGAGYRTAGFVSAPYLSSQFGFARGFDLYDDFSVPFTPERESREQAQTTVSSPLLYPQVERWLRETARAPFFLFVHFFDVHYDYVPPPPYDTMFDPDYQGTMTGENFHENPRIRPGMPARDLEHLLALYDGEIRYVDGYIGRTLDLLAELGLADDTLVVLTADHGEEFLEHGDKGHHRTLYEEVVHVPLIVAWPGRLPAGRVIDDPVSIVDVVPTVLELAGLGAPAGVEGMSLVAQMRGGPAPDREIVAELYRKATLNMQVAVRRGDAKLIQSLNFPQREFYDLASDPGEQRSRLGDGEPARLTRDLARWLAATWPAHRALSAGPRTVALDQGRVDALRALGYVE
jgi:arylsulfatase A-like enzyme